MNHIYTAITIFTILSICSLALITSKLETWRKIPIVLALCLSGALSYRTLNQVYGLPALIEQSFDEAWVHAYHADPDSGWIYIWIRPDDSEMPISYKMLYSEKLHKKLESNFKKTGGKPYKGSIDIELYPLERFEESVDDVEVDVLPQMPPKNK